MDLSKSEKRILTHNIFACEKKHLSTILKYSHFTNFKKMEGKSIKILTNSNICRVQQFDRQTALEFLLIMFFHLDQEIEYKIIKIRSFLLKAKGIKFDIDLLHQSDHSLSKLVDKTIHYRDKWFTNEKISDNKIIKLVTSFYDSLKDLLFEELDKNTFFLPKSRIQYTRNIVINRNDSIKKKCKGFTLPNYFTFLGTKYYNLNSRFKSMEHCIPFLIPPKNSVVQKRFIFFDKQIKKYNNSRLFIPLIPSTNLYRIQ